MTGGQKDNYWDTDKFEVGDLVSRDGTDVQKVMGKNGFGQIEVKCIVPPADRWCQVGDREWNLARRYHHVDDDAIERKVAPSRTEEALSWIGTGLQVVGATAVASRLVDPYWGYFTMLPGALIWLGIARHRRDWSQAALQMTFVGLNIIGIYRWAA